MGAAEYERIYSVFLHIAEITLDHKLNERIILGNKAVFHKIHKQRTILLEYRNAVVLAEYLFFI